MKTKYQNKNIIGADETGVGDYLTPLVCAAVFVPIKNIDKLLSIGVTDSKKISDKNIIKLFGEMKPLIKSSVRFLSQAEYNNLTKRFNAHELKTIIHMNAMSSVEERIDEEVNFIILDQYVNENSFAKYKAKLQSSNVEVQFPKSNIIMVEKGELEHVSVAAASIVARAYLLKMMESQNKKWKLKFPFGVNDKVILCAKKFVETYGEQKLSEVAKISFKTTNQILKK